MEQIIENFTDPSWWFTGVFFVIALRVIPWLIKQLHLWLRSWNRSTRAKQLKKIKNLRRDIWQIHYQIAVERSHFLIFVLLCLFYFTFFITNPQIQDRPTIFILALPLLFVEINWLNRNDFIKQLLKYSQRIS